MSFRQDISEAHEKQMIYWIAYIISNASEYNLWNKKLMHVSSVLTARSVTSRSIALRVMEVAVSIRIVAAKKVKV